MLSATAAAAAAAVRSAASGDIARVCIKMSAPIEALRVT